MILRRTERDFKEALKTWYKHGSHDKTRHFVYLESMYPLRNYGGTPHAPVGVHDKI